MEEAMIKAWEAQGEDGDLAVHPMFAKAFRLGWNAFAEKGTHDCEERIRELEKAVSTLAHNLKNAECAAKLMQHLAEQSEQKAEQLAKEISLLRDTKEVSPTGHHRDNVSLIGMLKPSYGELCAELQNLKIERANRLADVERLLAWLDDQHRKRAVNAFTEGPERQLAYRFESLLAREPACFKAMARRGGF